MPSRSSTDEGSRKSPRSSRCHHRPYACCHRRAASLEPRPVPPVQRTHSSLHRGGGLAPLVEAEALRGAACGGLVGEECRVSCIGRTTSTRTCTCWMQAQGVRCAMETMARQRGRLSGETGWCTAGPPHRAGHLAHVPVPRPCRVGAASPRARGVPPGPPDRDAHQLGRLRLELCQGGGAHLPSPLPAPPRPPLPPAMFHQNSTPGCVYFLCHVSR